MSDRKRPRNKGHVRAQSDSSNNRNGNQTSGLGCVHCRQFIPFDSYGTKHRNHCPSCLWSRHVDDRIGDRQCACRSPMEPIALEVRRDGEWAIVHRCTGCDLIRTNRIAGDDHVLALLSLALRPIANPAFPLDSLGP